MPSLKGPDASEFREQLLGFYKKVWRLEQTRFFNSPVVAFSLHRVPAKVLSANRITDDSGEPALQLEIKMEVGDFDLRHLDRDDIEAFILTYRMLTQNNDKYPTRERARNHHLSGRLSGGQTGAFRDRAGRKTHWTSQGCV